MSVISLPTFWNKSECGALDLSKNPMKSSKNGFSGVNGQVEYENDQFYFSNMLRSMVLSGCNRSTGPSTTSRQQLNSWPPVPYIWSNALPALSLLNCTKPHHHNICSNNKIAHLKFRQAEKVRDNCKRRKLEEEKCRPNSFRLHESSAFAIPSTSCCANRQRNTSSINVRYVTSNLGKIFGLLQNEIKLEARVMKERSDDQMTDGESKQQQTTERPPCKRFSALIGLEIVVDYVKRNDK